MKIAICDDCQRDAEALKALCQKEGDHSLDIYLNSNSLCEKYKNRKDSYDLVFLDVDMPGLNGIEAGRELRSLDKSLVIVFVTAYDQFAIDAFSCEAFDYVLKPCKEKRILEILTKTKDKLTNSLHYHIIRTKGKTLRLSTSEIYYVECLRKHVIYHTRSSFFDTVGSLSEAYASLKEHHFLQIHQGYLVNMEKIVDFDDRFVILDNGFQVEMSVRKRKEALLKYAEYVERSI